VLTQSLSGQEKAAPKTALTSELQAIIEELGSQDLTTQTSALGKLKGQKDKRPALPALHAFLAAHRDDTASESLERTTNLIEIVQILVEVGDPGSLPLLQEVLAREENEVSKDFLAWGTAALGDPSGSEMLVARLKDMGTTEVLRGAAAKACADLINRGRLQPVVLLEVARQASKDWDSKNVNKGKSRAQIRAEVDAIPDSQLDAELRRSQALHRLGEAYRDVWRTALATLAATKKGVPVLVAALRDPDPGLVDLRLEIVIDLGASKDDRAVVALIDLLRESSDEGLKSAAKEELQNITGQKFGEDAGAWSAWWTARNKSKARNKK